MLEGEVPDAAATAFLDDLGDIERNALIHRSLEAVSLDMRSDSCCFPDNRR